MNTLLIRLSAPMQSWGTQSRFTMRDTGLEPSKSGVIGLLCAAMGIDREDDDGLQSLASLHMGVRVDKEGLLLMDYHTAQNVLMANKKDVKDTEVSTRYYLADAVFLVGLESENLALLERIQSALLKPVWALFLGRKAFVPTESIVLKDDAGLLTGLRKGETLKEALGHFPSLRKPSSEKLRLVIEDDKGTIVRSDQPISFGRATRKFAPRRVRVDFIPAPEPLKETI